MPKREPKPFWREQTRCYYVQLGKKQHRLSPDRDEAYRLYHELLSRPPEQLPATAIGQPLLVVEVLDAFLEWAQANGTPRTYQWRKENLVTFPTNRGRSGEVV